VGGCPVRARPTSFPPLVNRLGATTHVLLGQLSAVTAKTELGGFAGRLGPSELEEIDRTLPTSSASCDNGGTRRFALARVQGED
jgi:hypothetical protein